VRGGRSIEKMRICFIKGAAAPSGIIQTPFAIEAAARLILIDIPLLKRQPLLKVQLTYSPLQSGGRCSEGNK